MFENQIPLVETIPTTIGSS